MALWTPIYLNAARIAWEHGLCLATAGSVRALDSLIFSGDGVRYSHLITSAPLIFILWKRDTRGRH